MVVLFFFFKEEAGIGFFGWSGGLGEVNRRRGGGGGLVPVTAATSLQQVRELFAQLDQLEGVNALAVFLDRE